MSGANLAEWFLESVAAVGDWVLDRFEEIFIVFGLVAVFGVLLLTGRNEMERKNAFTARCDRISGVSYQLRNGDWICVTERQEVKP